MSAERVFLYTRFERFWHWAQAALVIGLGLTGFEIHGSYGLLGFRNAVRLHEALAWTWLGLYTFILFWHLTNGQWKQYVPTTRKLGEVALYYAWGIFRGEKHPFEKCAEAKHNPMQRLVYLGLAVVLIPLQMATGLLYLTYNRWAEFGLTLPLSPVALLHVAGAFAFAAFLVVHVYMTTTGSTVTSHMKAMCTGWEETPNRV